MINNLADKNYKTELNSFYIYEKKERFINSWNSLKWKPYLP